MDQHSKSQFRTPPELGIQNHRLLVARQLNSPHADARPDPEDINLLVVHAISLPRGNYGGPFIDDLFMGCLNTSAHPSFETLRDLRVSAHLCLFRNGEIAQYVPFDHRAWHAGASSFDGRDQCNDFAIGLELEGCDDDPFTDIQYTMLGRVGQALLREYPGLTLERIAGHADIAPARKTDPGPRFEWSRALFEIEFPR